MAKLLELAHLPRVREDFAWRRPMTKELRAWIMDGVPVPKAQARDQDWIYTDKRSQSQRDYDAFWMGFRAVKPPTGKVTTGPGVWVESGKADDFVRTATGVYVATVTIPKEKVPKPTVQADLGTGMRGAWSRVNEMREKYRSSTAPRT